MFFKFIFLCLLGVAAVLAMPGLLCAQPVPPTDVTIYHENDGLASVAIIRWTHVPPNVDYNIYRSTTDPFDGFQLIATVEADFYVDALDGNAKAFYHIKGSIFPEESGPSNTVGFVKVTCPGNSNSGAPFGLPFEFWDIVAGIPQYGVVSRKPSDIIGAQLTGGPLLWADRCYRQNGDFAYRTTTSALWGGLLENNSEMVIGRAYWIWNQQPVSQNMVLAGEVDTSIFGPIAIAANTYTPLSFRDARVQPVSHLNLLACGFTGGTGATSDRLLQQGQGGAWCFYKADIGAWVGSLTHITPGKAYWIHEKHGNTWDYWYGPGPMPRPDPPSGNESAVDQINQSSRSSNSPH